MKLVDNLRSTRSTDEEFEEISSAQNEIKVRVSVYFFSIFSRSSNPFSLE